MKKLTTLSAVIALTCFSSLKMLAQEKIEAAATPVVATINADSTILQNTVFTEEEMKTQWQSFSADKGWKALMKEVEAKGFKRIERSSWGFKGELKNIVTQKSEDVMFCAFDFYNPATIKEKTFQTCSMIWRKVGKDVYKAYIVFPKGVSEKEKAFAGAEEWFADNEGAIQKAHSFNKCFNRCINGGRHSVAVDTKFGSVHITADCKSQCLSAVAVCGGVTAILEVASGGLGTPVLIATFGICSGIACGQCFAMCALGCQ